MVSSRASSRAASPARDGGGDAPLRRTETRSEEVTLSSSVVAGAAGATGADETPDWSQDEAGFPSFGLRGVRDSEEGDRDDTSPPSGSRQDEDAVSVADAEGPAAEPSWAEVFLLELLENRPTGLQRIAEYYLVTECAGPEDLFTRALLMLQNRREARDADRILSEQCVQAILLGGK